MELLKACFYRHLFLPKFITYLCNESSSGTCKSIHKKYFEIVVRVHYAAASSSSAGCSSAGCSSPGCSSSGGGASAGGASA